VRRAGVARDHRCRSSRLTVLSVLPSLRRLEPPSPTDTRSFIGRPERYAKALTAIMAAIGASSTLLDARRRSADRFDSNRSPPAAGPAPSSRPALLRFIGRAIWTKAERAAFLRDPRR